MSDDFMDFTLGSGDESVGKKTERFSVDDDTSYRVSLVWFSVPKLDEDGKVTDWDDDAAFEKDGSLNPKAVVRFTGCERVYKKGVGYIKYQGPAYAQFGRPKQAVATILCSWPTDKEGDLDVASFQKGKGWQIQPWIFSTDKYDQVKKIHKRTPLTEKDMLITCPPNGAEYQKMTFLPEDQHLFRKLLASDKPEYKAVVKRMLADIRAVASRIHNDLARKMTIDEINDALGNASESPTGTDHSARDVDDALNGII